MTDIATTNEDFDGAESASAPALADTVAKLCAEGRDGSRDALDRCETLITNFGAIAIDRRQRASSMTALRLAIGNRMPAGATKAHIDQILLDRLAEIRQEGRFDGSSRSRLGFST